MDKTHSRKGDYEHEKWLIQQRILGVLVFILSVLICTIEMDFTPCCFTIFIPISMFMPDKKKGDGLV